MSSHNHDWSILPLADVVKADKPIVYGIVQAGPECPGGVPYLKSTDVRGKIDPSSLSRTSREISDRYGRSVVRPGDIVFSLRGNIGELSIVPPDLPEANLTQGTARISVNGHALNDYVAFALREPSLQRKISRLGKGSTFQEISLEALRKIEISLPPLPEQRKIAEILRTWDEAIEKLEAVRAAKELRFRWLQQNLIDQRFNSYSNFLEQYAQIPNLEKITSVDGLRRLTVKLHCKGIMANGRDAPVILSDKGRPYYRRKSGELLIGRQNFHNGGFGIVPPELDGFIASNAITSIRVDNAKLDSKYLLYFLSRKDYYLRIGHIMDGTGQKELSDKQIRKLPVSIPSLEKQVEVVQILNAANEEISLIDTKIEALTRQKRGLMQKLLTGEWRVRTGAADG